MTATFSAFRGWTHHLRATERRPSLSVYPTHQTGMEGRLLRRIGVPVFRRQGSPHSKISELDGDEVFESGDMKIPPPSARHDSMRAAHRTGLEIGCH